MPTTLGGAVDALRDHEYEAHQQLEAIELALRSQPEIVEQERNRARAEYLAANEKAIEKIRSRWEAATALARDALAAEQAFVFDMLKNGFGGSGMVFADLPWLSRDALAAAK